MTTPNHSFRIVPTPSGVINSDFPDGNDGAVTIPLVWATIPNTAGNVQGTPVTIHIRTLYLTEPGSPNATLAIVGPALSGGWALGANDLTFSGTGILNTIVQISATRNGVVVTSNFFQIESIASTNADITAPTIPAGVSVIVSAVTPTTNTISCDASTDPLVPNSVVSGLKDYRLYKDSLLIQTTNSSGLGLSPVFTYNDIGSTGVSGNAAQAGANWTITSAGTQIGGVADSCGSLFAPIVGDCVATFKINSFTAANLNANLALMLRVDLTPGSVATWITIKPIGGVGIKVFSRLSPGLTVVQNGNTIANNPPIYFKAIRQDPGITFYYSSNGTAWSAAGVAVNIVGLPSTLYVGVAMASNDAAATAVGVIQQLSIQNIAGVSFDDAGNVPGATHSYTVTARDIALNESAQSASVTALTPGGSQTFYFVENWESGIVDPHKWGLLGVVPTPPRRQVQTAIKRGGTYACYQDLNKFVYTDYNDPAVRGRTEMHINAPNDNEFGVEYWFGFSIYLKDWPLDPFHSGWNICFQLHIQGDNTPGSPTRTGTINPQCNLIAENDGTGVLTWSLQVLGSAQTCAEMTGNFTHVGDYQAKYQKWLIPAVVGKWHDFVFNFKTSSCSNPGVSGAPCTNGFMRAWINGVSTDPPIYDYSGLFSFPNGYANIQNDFWKIGIYHGWSQSGGTTFFSNIIDEIRWIRASQGGNFNAVNPVTYAGPRP